MQKKWRIISPKVVVDKEEGFGRRISFSTVIFVVLIVLFIAGYFSGRHELVPLRHANLDLRQEVLTLTEEVRGLVDRNASLEQEIADLKVTQQIDQNALRVAQADHKQLQAASLELEKDFTALKRFVRAGRGGSLKIKNLSLTHGQAPEIVNYTFTVMQLIEDFSDSAGEIVIRVSGVMHGKHITLRLEELSGSEPLNHSMRFKHFQNIRGSLRIPEGMVPEAMEIEIIPSTKKLMPLKEKFNWLFDS